MRPWSRFLLVALGGLFTSIVQAGLFDPDINGTGMSMSDYLRPVTAGGEPGGPAYTYDLGKYEITNRQLVVFLNDAERDALSGAPTRRSSNMYFTPAGSVYMDSNTGTYEMLFRVDSGNPDFDITYDSYRLVGGRYAVKAGLDKHPARYLSWAGAIKFCNWLTIDQGLGEANCCYSEGPNPGDWHPVVITTQDWWGKQPAQNDRVSAGRNLNDQERADWVRHYRGFRLPMDDTPLLAPINRPNPNDFNEWLKAAAWDRNAPDTTRTNAGGWQALPDHWMYSFGRETNTGADANWYNSGDPYDNGTAPVDYYDGTNHGGAFQTSNTANRHGFYGMSGNVWEWCTDYGVSMDKRAIYGGSWVSTPERQAGSSCYQYGYVDLADLSFGLRIGQVCGPVESKLTASDAFENDEFGRVACISGDYVISGSHFDDDAGDRSGSAYVYRHDLAGWVQEAKLTALDAQAGDHFGRVVSIDGQTALLGAQYSDDAGESSGSAYVFTRDAGTWSQQAKLTASDAAGNDQFGCAVAVSGDYALVGAYLDDDGGLSTGSAYIFKRTGTTWAQTAKLTASDPQAGADFGYSVSLDGDYAVVGAYLKDEAAFRSGAAYVFKRDGENWPQQQKLFAADGADSDCFGLSVSIDGDVIAVSATFDDDMGEGSGSVYIFRRDGTVWNEEAKLNAPDGGEWEFFGHNVSISGDYVIAGAFAQDGIGADSGSAYVFQRHNSVWVLKHKLVASDTAAGDQYGQAASVSGEFAVAGSPYDSDGGYHSGSVYVYELGPPSANMTITVCPDGRADFSTIQDAIDAAVDGDEIVLCDGTYTGTGNKDLTLAGKAITIRSANGPADCTIDCQQDGRAFYLVAGEDADSIIDGLSMINGDPHGDFGGAIYLENSSPTIRNCVFRDDVSGAGGAISLIGSHSVITNCLFSGGWAWGGGALRCTAGSDAAITYCTFAANFGSSAGAVYINRSSPIVANCIMSGNAANNAGAIYAYLSNAVIANCIITGNRSLGGGGGIELSSSSFTITNCRITGNACKWGGGLYFYNAAPTVANCTVRGNAATDAGGGIYCVGNGIATAVNTIFWDDTCPLGAEIALDEVSGLTVSYSDVQGGQANAYVAAGASLQWGSGNIDADPLFTDGPAGNWTSDATYDAEAVQVTLTDATANWTANQWVGYSVNPDLTQPLRFFIVGNTATTITVLADRTTLEAGAAWVTSGASYQLYDEHLPGGSPCINGGSNAGLPPDAADLDGDGNVTEPVPYDLDPGLRVQGCIVDMGADEIDLPAELSGDFDDDCDVDGDDTTAFRGCMTAPGIPQYNPGCADAALDEDQDVDQTDFGLFQRCLSGEGVLPDPHCAD